MIHPVPGIERAPNSNVIYATLTWNHTVVVKERIPLWVLYWSPEEQAGYYRGVMGRLNREIMAMTVPVAHKQNRKERRARA